jgi:CHAD domain-containing protein
MASPPVKAPVDTRKFAREQAGRLVGRLAFQVNHTTKSCDSAAVHDLQTAIRRFSRLLKVFQPCFDGKETRKLRRRLKRLLEIAHGVGRLDIAIKVLAKAPRQEGATLRSKLQSRRKEGARDLTGALQRWIDRKSSMKWRAALDASLSGQGEVFRGILIDQFAAEMLPAMAKDFFHSGNEAAAAKAPAPVVEEFRVAVRRLRNTLELFTALYGSDAGRWLEKVRETQALLGAIRNWGVAEEVISPFKGSDAVAGWVKKRQRKQREKFRHYWRQEFGDAENVRTWIASLSSAAPKVRSLKKPVGRSLNISSRSVAGQGHGKRSLTAAAR